MTHTALRTALNRLGLSQVGAARILGIDPRTMRRYCSGELPVPRWLPLALRGIKEKDILDTPSRMA